MDLSKAGLIICITIVVVVGINVMIYLSLRDRSQVTQIDLFRRAARGASRPWAREDSDLSELSRRVEELKQPASKSPDDEGQ